MIPSAGKLVPRTRPATQTETATIRHVSYQCYKFSVQSGLCKFVLPLTLIDQCSKTSRLDLSRVDTVYTQVHNQTSVNIQEASDDNCYCTVSSCAEFR